MLRPLSRGAVPLTGRLVGRKRRVVTQGLQEELARHDGTEFDRGRADCGGGCEVAEGASVRVEAAGHREQHLLVPECAIEPQLREHKWGVAQVPFSYN